MYSGLLPCAHRSGQSRNEMTDSQDGRVLLDSCFIRIQEARSRNASLTTSDYNDKNFLHTPSSCACLRYKPRQLGNTLVLRPIPEFIMYLYLVPASIDTRSVVVFCRIQVNGDKIKRKETCRATYPFPPGPGLRPARAPSSLPASFWRTPPCSHCVPARDTQGEHHKWDTGSQLLSKEVVSCSLDPRVTMTHFED